MAPSGTLFTKPNRQKIKFSFGLVNKVPEGAILGTWYFFKKNPKFYIFLMKKIFRDLSDKFI